MALNYSIKLALPAPARPLRAHRARPFVVGVGRSGTTLLRMMLDAHPELAIPPETHFVLPFIQASKAALQPATATRSIVRDERRAGTTSASPSLTCSPA